MSRIPELRIARNNKIKAEYAKLEAEKIHGTQKYRYEAILAILGKRYYLSPATIKNILLSEDETTNQLDMFKDGQS